MSPSRRQVVCRISKRKAKRVTVTSCDSCRLRKLKVGVFCHRIDPPLTPSSMTQCNAKDLPLGAACNQCSKQGTKCTFDDRDELQPPVKVRSSLAQPIRAGLGQERHDQSDGAVASRFSSPQSRSTISQKTAISQQRASENHHQDRQDSRLDAPFMAQLNTSTGWGHEQASMVLASIGPSLRSVQEAAVWDDWNVPGFITDPENGHLRPITGLAVMELLLRRFYEQPSFNCIVVPNHGEVENRMRVGTLPSYLLHTMIACACASSLTTEHELLLWQAQIWHGATESVHSRLNRAGSPELELVQALLLLSCNWPGSLLRIERINTFETAVSLATSLQLHSGGHLDVSPGPRTRRITLFWALFCTDKIISVLTKRTPMIPTALHSMPMPSIEDVAACSGYPSKTPVSAWLQRLAFAFITLSQLTENVQMQLILPIHSRQITTLDQVFHRILPIEKRLENFCKEQRWLLGTVSDLSPLCRSMAQAVLSQLHFTQLHLYLPALQLEVNWAGAFSMQPTRFSTENDKPMAATIESAWHLVQQPIRGVSGSLASIAHAASITPPSSLRDHNASLTFLDASVLVGMNFFKFLANNWTDWEGGSGCTRFVTISQPLQVVPDTHVSADEMPDAVHDLHREHSQASTSRLADKGCDREDGEEESPVEDNRVQNNKRPLAPLHIVQSQRQNSESEAEETLCGDTAVVAGANAKTASFDTADLSSYFVTTPAPALLLDQQDKAASAESKINSKTTGELPPGSHATLPATRPDCLLPGTKYGADAHNEDARQPSRI